MPVTLAFDWANLAPLAAEIIVGVGALVLLMVGVFVGERSSRLVAGLAIGVLAVAFVAVVFSGNKWPAFAATFVFDDFAKVMKAATLFGSGVALVMTMRPAARGDYDRFELPILFLTSTLGMMLMISANDLISLYLGLELQSLSLYVLAAINRDSLRSTEAGLKYFVLGALSSGMLLYGASLVYGFTGYTTFPEIAAALSAGRSTGVVIGLVFVFAGLAFKMSAVPFHMWTPDVYEGAPTPITAFFAAAPKLAAFALTIRVAVDAFGPVVRDWQQILSFVAVASMLLGAFAAIGQTNIKRLMAYSSIGHVGYALVGLAAGTEAGVAGVVIYMLIYLAMTLGTFAFILAMRRGGEDIESTDSLSGLSRTQPLSAFFLAALLFSLAGIPPLAGFFAKWYVFLAAVQAGLYTLAVIGVVTSVIGAYYYLRIVKIMYFDDPDTEFDRMPVELGTVLALSGVFTIGFVLLPAPVVLAAEAAARSLF